MRTFSVIALFLIMFTPVSAQTGNGRIQGNVRDTSGAVIPGVQLKALHKATGQAFSAISNEAGFYLFPSVPTGDYSVSAEFTGMSPWKGDLFLQTGQTAVVDATLAPAGNTSEVTVVGDVTPLLTTTTGTLASVLERQRIEQLPLNGRQIQGLIPTTVSGIETSVNWQIVNGVRAGSLEYMQDGAAITNRERSQITSRPPGMDTINEMRVETNASSAKYDRPATVIMTTRSGTNQFHGSLFETARNNSLGIARRREEFFDKAPKLIRNEFGASAGGPVYLPKVYDGRNRTFFFVAREDYRLFSGATQGVSMPTMAMRQGDFSGLVNAAGQRTTLYDPWTTDAKYGRVPFANNQIPITLESPVARYLYSVTPEPTLPDVNPMVASNFFGRSATQNTNYTFTTRVDHRLSDRDQLFFRFSRSSATNIVRRSASTNGSPILLDRSGNNEDSVISTYGGVVNWNHTFSPTFFVETIVGQNAEDSGAPRVPRYPDGKNIADILNLPNPFNFAGLPDITNTGFNMVYIGTRSNVNPSFTNILLADQNYTLVKGSHTLEFGWRYRRERTEMFPLANAAKGAFGFNSNATALYDPATGQQMGTVPRSGNDAANMFLGVLANYNVGFFQRVMEWKGTQAGTYLQDSWKVSSRLTLNLGLRYEYYSPIDENNGMMAGFDLKNRSVVTSAPLDKVIAAGGTTASIIQAYRAVGVNFESPEQAGLPYSLVNSNYFDFSPRVGFAYRMGSGKHMMSLRGGFGVYRWPLSMRVYDQKVTSTPPLTASFARNFNSAAQNPDGLANYWLRNAPTVIAGVNSRDIIDATQPPNITPGGFTVNFQDPNQPTSRSYQWNMTLEREVLENTVARIAYVGTRGAALDNWLAINGQPTNYVWMMTTGTAPPTGRYASTARRVYDQTTYGAINEFTKNGYSNFNSLQAEVQRRYTKGYAFQFFYVLSNAFRTLGTGSTGPIETWVNDPRIYMPGAVPEDLDARIRMFTYLRDTDIPQHRLRWNWLIDLPVGKGKALFGNASGWKQQLLGGWQVAGGGNGHSNYFDLPTGNWGTMGPIEVYGRKYPIEDCRSGDCVPGYLWYNGYIPANRINSYDAQGRPNGVMGVPDNYRPAVQPIWPMPAGGSAGDLNASLYETNNVFVPLSNGKTQRVAMDTGLHPWMNQSLPAPWGWGLDASLFKTFPIKERMFLRFNVDFFNVLNHPGTPGPNAGTGIVSLRTSANGPRQLQLTLRLTW